MPIEGQVIVITGAASGIGRGLAKGFSADGGIVVGFDTNADGLQETAGACSGAFTPIVGDVCSDDDVARLVDETVGANERIDVLINNAGIANAGNFLERPFADWQAVIDVNLTGLARCLWHVLPVMKAQAYGRVVNVCSREGETGRRTLSAYSASKGGVAVLTKSIARELGKEGFEDVLVSGLIPGGTLTNMNRNEKMQHPDVVYPHTRFIAEQPRGAPNGRVYFRSEDYPMFTLFNGDRARITPG